MQPPDSSYPRNARGFIIQCAWCHRVADQSGRFRLHAVAIIEAASHGCCDSCAAQLRRAVRQPGTLRRSAA